MANLPWPGASWWDEIWGVVGYATVMPLFKYKFRYYVNDIDIDIDPYRSQVQALSHQQNEIEPFLGLI